MNQQISFTKGNAYIAETHKNTKKTRIAVDLFTSPNKNIHAIGVVKDPTYRAPLTWRNKDSQHVLGEYLALGRKRITNSCFAAQILEPEIVKTSLINNELKFVECINLME